MSETFVPPPKPSLNGGLYTGEPFAPNAMYANFPAVPDAGYMIHYNLRSANPPLDALVQYPGTNRPGNNYQRMPGIVKQSELYNYYCSSPVVAVGKGKPHNMSMSKYFYL